MSRLGLDLEGSRGGVEHRGQGGQPRLRRVAPGPERLRRERNLDNVVLLAVRQDFRDERLREGLGDG